MIGRALLAAVVLAMRLPGQQGAAHVRALAMSNDTALASAVRVRPADAREALGLLIEASVKSSAKDSALAAAHRVADALVGAFADSFPVKNLGRFERMSDAQRRTKVSADSVRLAGNAALGRRGVDAAIALWRDAVGRARSIPDTAGMAAAIGNIGAGFYQALELDSAEAYLTRARELAGAVGDHRTSLNALGILGSVASDRGDQRRAQAIYTETLSMRAAIGDVRGASADHNNLGLIAADLGDLTDARAHYREALAIAKANDLADPAATALLNLANAASADGAFAEARSQYSEALSLYRSLDDSASIALTLHNLGLLALRRGAYGESREMLLQAAALFGRVGTPDDVVQVRRDLASVSAGIGDLGVAMRYLRRAEAGLPGVSDRGEAEAGIALARGDLAWQLNTLPEADRQYARAQSLYHAARNASGEAEAAHGRALLLIHRRQYAAALAQLNVILRSQRASGDRRPVALTLVAIASVQREMGDTADARRALTRGADTLRALGDVVGEAEALGALADLELKAGTPLTGEALYRRALAVLGAQRIPTVRWSLHAGLARALRARGATDEAAAAMRAAIAEIEQLARAVPGEERRSFFLSDKWAPYAELALLEQSRGSTAEAFLVTERMRARQLLDALDHGRVRTRGDTTVVSRSQDLRRRIDELTVHLEEEARAGPLRGPGLSDTTAAATREALSAAQSEYTQLLLDLRDDTGVGSALRATPSPWRAVAARLSRGQAMLAYLVSDSTTLAFVVTTDTVRAVDLGVSRDKLASLVEFTRGTLSRSKGDSGVPAWRAPLRRLHRQLIEPLEDARLLEGVRQIVIVPNAELHYLPFAALIRSRAGARDEYLIERYDIAYAPSASAWLRLGDRAPAAGRVLAMAPRPTALPGSRREVDAIGRLYGPQAVVLAGAAATERVLHDSAAQFGIIHLATYGVLNLHNPLFSFVDLVRGGGDDGRLETHEVLGLTLNARLLVLSACQTALASGAVSDVPAGDDWVGLVRAFLGAGAQNVIATLWAVEDRSTAVVMERLHRRLRAGESEESALSQAQRETLRNPGTAGPFYWAGFVLVGGRRGASQ